MQHSRIRYAAVLVTGVLISLSAWGQTPDARQLVHAAVAAMGGGKLASVPGISMSGQSTSYRPGQDGQRTFVWKIGLMSGGVQFRAETTTSDGTTTVFSTGNGKPGILKNGKLHRFAAFVGDPGQLYQVPVLILANDLANTNSSFTIVSDDSTQTAVHIRIYDSTEPRASTLTLQDWYFDLLTLRPLQVRYRVPDTLNALSFIKAATTYSNFQSAGGLVLPYHMDLNNGDDLVATVVVNSIDVTTSFQTSDFDLGGGN